MKKVIVGMSGGVDSAVAAYLLKQEGYDVVGVTLRTWVASDGGDGRCCEIDDARETARSIGIPFHVFNCVSDFDEKVVKPFVGAYLRGLTPNPCVVCNREIKWARLLYHADVLGADFVATGHYASVVRLDNGRWTVRRALHAEKDQTYMLCRLAQEQLSRTLMPLGGYSKQEVRAIAERAGIKVASKPDSQEICFVADGDYADFIAGREGVSLPPEGDFVDGAGNVLGRHRGIVRYTVGQRRGLGVALGRPAYVKRIDAERNEVVLGTEEELRCRAVECADMNFMSVPEPVEKLRCRAVVRYSHAARPATVESLGGGRYRVAFDEPVRSAAPGQSAVFYDENDCLMGGGTITDVLYD